jgi:hypothetical protein
MASSAMGAVPIGGSTGLTGVTTGEPSSLPQMAAATALVGVDDNAVGETEDILHSQGAGGMSPSSK